MFYIPHAQASRPMPSGKPQSRKMPEFRQNPLTGQWVIVAPRRAERPQDFSTARPRPRPAEYVEDCPFCPGHERQTPPEVYAVRDDYATTDGRGWRVRVVPNKYPALTIDDHGVSTPRPTPSPAAASGPNPPMPEADSDKSPLRAAIPGVGMHEVIVESPAHDQHFALHDDRQAELIVFRPDRFPAPSTGFPCCAPSFP